MTQAIETLLGGLVSGFLFALVALGYSLIFRVTGVLNLAQGAFVILGILATYSLESSFGWPLPAAVATAALLAFVLGALLERFVIRPASARQSTSGLLILTAGLLTVFEGAALLVWGSQPYALPPFSGRVPLTFGTVAVSQQALWVAGTTVVLLAGTWYLLARTVFGRALRACAENPSAASLMGIDVARMSLFAFGAGAAIGAVGGVVAGPLISVSFDSGSYFTNAGFIAVALGGMGSFLGSIAGGLALGVLEQVGAGYVSSLFSNTLAFVLLLLMLVFRPSGLLGRGPGREDAEAAPLHLGLRAHFPMSGRATWLAALVAVAVVLLLPTWLEPSGLTASFVIAGLLFIAVLGLDLLMGFAGQVSLGQAGFMAIGAYAAGILSVKYHAPPLLGILVGLVLSLLVALVLALITGRLRGLYLALATLGFGLLVDSLTVGLSDLTGGPSGLVGIPNLVVGDYAFVTPLQYYYLVWGLAALLLLLTANVARSDYGRALQSIRADQTAARALGVAVPLYKVSALLISAGFASIAGSLYAFDFHYISPELVSTSRSLEMVSMLVIGGQGTLIGPLLGTLLVTLLPSAAQALAQYKTLIEGCILVLILLFLPGGLLGGVAELASRVVRPRPVARGTSKP